MIGSTLESHNMKKVNKYLGVLGLPKLGSNTSPLIEKQLISLEAVKGSSIGIIREEESSNK